jgi:hypothetical protein
LDYEIVVQPCAPSTGGVLSGLPSARLVSAVAELYLAAAHAMSIWTLVILIALAWLLYPFAGAAGVRVAVLEGKRPKDAGFSFIPELIVFPVVFLGVAAVIDYFAMPYGRWIVGGICVAMLAQHVYVFLRSLIRIRQLEHQEKSNDNGA